MAAIAGADPGFDRFAFLQMACTRFVAIKQASTAWQPEGCAALMTTTAYQSWSAPILAQRDRRVRNIFDDLQVGEPQVMWAAAGDGGEHITLQMNAMSIHYAVDEATRQLVFGDPRQLQATTEYWTFSRPAGRTTRPGATASCSVCGAPLPAGAVACVYCKTAVAGPDGGWVISRMDDEIAWSDG